jgi:hypothetical protein
MAEITEQIKTQLIAKGVEEDLAARAAVVLAKPERSLDDQSIVSAVWQKLNPN